MSHSSSLSPSQARLVRRTCYVLILLSVLYISVPMVVSAFSAIQNGQAIDPYTGRPYAETELEESNCLIKGGELLKQVDERTILAQTFSSELEKLEVCRSSFPKVYLALKRAEQELKKKEAP